MKKISKILILFLTGYLLVSCDSSEQTINPSSDRMNPSPTERERERPRDNTTSPELNPTEDIMQLEASEIIKIKTSAGAIHKIKVKDGVWKYYDSQKNVYSIVSKQNTAFINDMNGKTVFTAKKENNIIQIFKASSPAIRLKMEGQKFKFYNSSAELVFRAKIKPDKINIYNKSGKRSAKCKPKDYGFGLYDTKGKRLRKILGKIKQQDTVFFCLPMDYKVASLFWFASKKL